MTANRLRLSGTVCKTPVRKVSPSGIPHCQFLLEHRCDWGDEDYARKFIVEAIERAKGK